MSKMMQSSTQTQKTAGKKMHSPCVCMTYTHCTSSLAAVGALEIPAALRELPADAT